MPDLLTNQKVGGFIEKAKNSWISTNKGNTYSSLQKNLSAFLYENASKIVRPLFPIGTFSNWWFWYTS